MQHFSQPINRAFLVGRAHALDKRADGVVVRIAGAIVDDGFLLNAFLGDRQRELNISSWIGRRCEHANFKRVQTFARIAVAQFREMPASLIVDLDRVISQTALFIGQGAIDQFLQLLHPQRFELKNL